jgi:hypothetical protein
MGLLGAFIVHLIIGASSRWNMLNAYATSYYKVSPLPLRSSTRPTSSSAKTHTPHPYPFFVWDWACELGSDWTRPLGRWPPAGLL